METLSLILQEIRASEPPRRLIGRYQPWSAYGYRVVGKKQLKEKKLEEKTHSPFRLFEKSYWMHWRQHFSEVCGYQNPMLEQASIGPAQIIEYAKRGAQVSTKFE